MGPGVNAQAESRQSPPSVKGAGQPAPASKVGAIAWSPYAAAFAALALASCAALWFIRHRGLPTGGDESTYLDAAYAIGRLHTWNLAHAVHSSFAESIESGPAQPLLAVIRHGVTFSDKPLGLSVLLAAPLALHPSLLSANLGLIIELSAATTWLGFEVARLSGGSRSSGAVVSLLFLTPEYLLATTQIYPDLISGVLLALIIVRLARLESDGPHGLAFHLMSGVLLGVFAWLDEKNFFVCTLLGLALYLLMRRRHGSLADTWCALAPAVVGLLTNLAYNVYAFGEFRGPAQQIAPFSVSALTKFGALFLGHRHGLLVQCPPAVIGVLGLVALYRRARLSVAMGVVSSVAILAGNASVSGGMGGSSFVGRYQWEVMPLLVSAAGVYLITLWATRRRAATVLVALLGALTAFESWEVWRDRPDPLSFMTNAWDPANHPGWWGRLDPSPDLNYLYHEWGNARNLWGLAFTVAVLGLALALLPRPNGRRVIRPSAAASLAVVAVGSGALALRSPFPLPAPLAYPASALGSLPFPIPPSDVVVSGHPRSAPILFGPRLPVLPGTYAVTLTYRLSTTSRTAAVMSVTLTATGRTRELSSATLDAGASHRETVTAVVTRPGVFNVVVRWNGPGSIRVRSVVVAKTSTCNVPNCEGGIL